MSRPTLLALALTASLVGGAQSVGLVLSGGGAVGLTHIGVLKALEENDVPIDYIAGSSMGALIGAMYAAGYSPWEIDSLFNTDLYMLMAEGGVEDRFVYYFKQDAPDASVFKMKFDVDTTLQGSLPTNLRSPVLIDFEQMCSFGGASAAAKENMDDLFVPFRCVASDITARKPVIFREGDLAQAVRASMSYPFYFKPIRVHGHIMMDGGLYNNFPADVMYADFMPDVILGSNVAYNSGPPSEDDLLSQLKAMLQQPTNYSLLCDPGLIIEPKTATTLFDFSDPARAIEDGYNAAIARMPEILAMLGRRAPRAQVEERRRRFRAEWPPLTFGSVRVRGLNKPSTIYAEKILTRQGDPMTAEELKPRYFRLHADNNVASLHPVARYNTLRGNYDLEVLVKREKELEARFGALFSTRPVSTGMVGLRYKFMGRSSNRVEALGYFGRFYAAAQAKLRADFSTRLPVYVEPAFTMHRWDHFSSFASFFDASKPAYIVQRELWAGFNAGLGISHKGLARLDLKYAQTKDSYYQNTDFSSTDTADVTEFFMVTTGLLVERNSLNRKQQPNEGECLRAEVRYVNGEERTTPGSSTGKVLPEEYRHEWVMTKVTLDKYFLPRGHFKFGLLAEAVLSGQPFFQNYTASVIRAPVFQPTPESRTYFLETYRASQYLAGGVRTIIAVARNKFDLRLEAYVFQPYKAIVRGDSDQAEEGTPISDRHYLASGSLIYQSPIGPLWFNTSYFEGLDEPWAFSLNFGYVIFCQKAME